MSIVPVNQAENFKKFIDVLSSDDKFRQSLVDKLNKHCDLYFFNEATEEIIYTYVLNCVMNTLENVADDLYATSLAAELEAQKQSQKDSKQD